MSSDPTKQMTADNETNHAQDASAEHGLTPGTVLDHGRYRLLSKVGSDPRCDAELWRAKDGVLGRDVALTILVGDRSDSQAAGRARRTLERAMHASTFNHVGVARVLDVVTQAPGDPDGVLGLVIAEWTHGTDLLDLVSDGPLPPGTCARLLQPLAAAVEAAHHAGLVLGADHPQRIRVTPDGEIRMAFPGPLPKATSSEDVRGLGATLYLLLTGRWALSDAPEGIAVAPTGADGEVVPPRTLRPTVPLELSTVSIRALGSPDTSGTTGGVRTGAAVLRVLEQHTNYDAQEAAAAGADEVWSTEDPKPDQKTRKKLFIGIGVLSVTTLLVVAWILAGLIGVFTGPDDSSGPSVTVGEEESPPGEGGNPKPAPPKPAPISGGEAFNMAGDPDSPHRIDFLFDGDPTSYWTTFNYFDQLGPNGLTPGTGAVLSLEEPAKPRAVTINSPSKDTEVEIYAVDGDKPDVEGSEPIGKGTIEGEETSIPVNTDQSTEKVLVLVTKLTPTDDGKFSSTINEVKILS